MSCGAGLATAARAAEALDSAWAAAMAPLPGPAHLVVVLVRGDGPDAAAEVEATLRAAAALAPETAAVLGCGVDALVVPGAEVRTGAAVGVWAVHAPGLSVRTFHLETLRTGDRLAVVGQPPTGDDSTAMLLLADAWTFPVDGFVAGVNREWPGLPVVGALAAGASPGDARLLHGAAVAARGAVGVVLGGDLGVEVVTAQGCRPVGPPLVVTEAEGSLLRALAGRPAADVLREVVATLVLDDPTAATARVHLGVAEDEARDEHGFGDFVVGDVIAIEGDALRVADVVPTGASVRFHVPDADAADADLSSLLWDVRRRPWVDGVDGALVVTGPGRDAAFFGDVGHDAAVVAQQWGCSAVLGLGSFGQIAPVNGRNHVNAWSAAVLAVTGSGDRED